MELQKIYEEYKSIYPELTQEMFDETYRVYGESYLDMIQDALKKKEPPTGEVTLTEEGPIPISSEMDLLPSQEQAMGESVVIHQGSSGLGSMDAPISTVLPSAEMGYSGGGSYHEGNTVPQEGSVDVTNPSLSVDLFDRKKTVQEEIINGDTPRRVVSVLGSRFSLPQLYTMPSPIVAKGVEYTQKVSKKPILEIGEVEQEYEYAQQRENQLLGFINGEHSEIPDVYISSDYYRKEVDENTLFGGDKDMRGMGLTPDTYNPQTLEWERQGLIDIQRDEAGNIIQHEGVNTFKIKDKKWLEDTNSEIRNWNKKVDEANIRISRKALNPTQSYISEYQKEINSMAMRSNSLLTDEEILKAKSMDDIYRLYADKMANADVKKGGRGNYEELYNKYYEEFKPDDYSEEELLFTGRQLLDWYNSGVSSDFTKTLQKKDVSSNGAYKEEIDFINQIKNDQNYLRQIGQYWLEKGRYEIGDDEVALRNQFRSDIKRNEFRQHIYDHHETRGKVHENFHHERIRALYDKAKYGRLSDVEKSNIQKEVELSREEISKIETRHQSIISYADNWKAHQKNFLRYERESDEVQAGYQNNEALPILKLLSARAGAGAIDAVKNTIGGVVRIANLPFNSKEVHSFARALDEKTEVYGEKNQGMQEVKNHYTLEGKTIIEVNGRYFEILNEKWVPVTISREGISNLKFSHSEKGLTLKGIIGSGAGMAADMGMAALGGGLIGKGVSLLGRTRALRGAVSAFGEGSSMVRGMRGFSNAIQNPKYNGMAGWYVQTFNANFEEGLAHGMNNTVAGMYANLQSGLTAVLSLVNPDVKFFNHIKTSQQKLITALSRGDRKLAKSAWEGIGDFSRVYAKSAGGEVAQEYLEAVFAEGAKILSEPLLDAKKFDRLTASEIKDIALETLIFTGGLVSFNKIMNKTPQSVNIKGVLHDISQMTQAERYVALANMDTSGVFDEMRQTLFSDEKSLAKIEQGVRAVRKVLDKIPNREEYSITAQAQAMFVLDKIDLARRKLATSDEVFKSDIQAEISALENELKTILHNDLEANEEHVRLQNIEENTEASDENTDTERVEEGVQNNVDSVGVSESVVLENETIPNTETSSLANRDESSTGAEFDVNNEVEDDGDIDFDFNDSIFRNEEIQGNNTPNDGATELGVESLPNTKGGQDNPQGVSQTINLGGNETEVEITQQRITQVEEDYRFGINQIKSDKSLDEAKTMLLSINSSIQGGMDTPNMNAMKKELESFIRGYSGNSERVNTPLQEELPISNAPENNEVETDSPKTPKSKDTGIERRKLSDLNTDESRFQGRKKLNETIVNNIANNFSDKDQDPIHIWTDPKDGKSYVLSGHHRFYGARRAGRKDVKVIDRSADFSEAEAIRFAKEEANANRSMETPLERANTLRQKRERGEDTKAFLENEGRNKNLVNNLSYLNPKGKAVQSMSQFDSANESDSKRETERIADWTGEVMRVFKDYLTPAHENEIYDYLNNKEKSKRFTNKREFVEKVRSLIGLDFDAKQPLNLSRVSSKGSQEQEWENEARRLRDEIADYEKQITDLDNRFTDPKREDYISPDTKNFQELKDRARKEKTRLKTKQEAVYKELDEHNSKKGNYLKADASMGNLFEDYNKTPYKKGRITHKAFGKLIEKLQKHFGKAFKKGVNITTDWQEFQRKADEYRNNKEQNRANEAFNKELENFDKGEHKGLLHLGVAGNILKSAGINVSITLSPSVLKSHLKKHGLKVSDLKGLAKALQTPNLIYQHGNTNIATVIITDLEVAGKKVSIALRVGKNGDIQELNNVSSIHGKKGDLERERLAEASDKGILKIKYIANKENVLNWLGIASLNGSSHTANPKHLSLANIINNFENPKIENENDADLEYLKTPSGVIYGAKLPDGTLYINPEHLNANTPIHEFGHIWEQLMPQRFAEGVKLLQNTKAGKELFQELRKNKGYQNYSDDRLWNEALVTMLGNRGEELYHSNSASKFVAWMKDFFKALGEYLHKMSGGKIGKELTPDDKMQTFIKGALAEIMGAKEIIPESNVAKKEVPIYLKDMTNAEIRTMLENMNLVIPAKCA